MALGVWLILSLSRQNARLQQTNCEIRERLLQAQKEHTATILRLCRQSPSDQIPLLVEKYLADLDHEIESVQSEVERLRGAP